MNLLRHSITTVLKTAARPVAVILAFMVVLAVVGMNPAFATIDNTATASGIYAGNAVNSNSDTVSVPVTSSNPSLEVTKVATPDTNVTAGTLVTYTYSVRNTGNTSLNNIVLSDIHIGSGPAPLPANETLTTDNGTTGDSVDVTVNDGVWSSLAPGDVITLTSTYTITQNDVDTKQ